jgi:mannose-6-phosphate isomerase
VEPILLPPNQLHRFYKGGARIAALRSSGVDDPYAPEEWIASMASPFGEPGVGLGVLPNGTSLPDAIAADPEGFLGREHVERFGADVAVLIKLLDSGERLPVHFHPNDDFARAHLGSRYGKTEAWIILETARDAAVHVGWREPVDLDQVKKWVDAQDASGMLAALHRLPVSPGATLFVPAGTPHAIGEGILLAELQQPTDFSVLMEWEGLAIDGPAVGHLGLGFDLALDALDLSAWTQDDIARNTSGRGRDASGTERLFPSGADLFFRAERIRPDSTPLEAEFSVLLVAEGVVTVAGDGWSVDAARGEAWLVPFGAGECTLEGDGLVIRCLPPDPLLKS